MCQNRYGFGSIRDKMVNNQYYTRGSYTDRVEGATGLAPVGRQTTIKNFHIQNVFFYLFAQLPTAHKSAVL